MSIRDGLIRRIVQGDADSLAQLAIEDPEEFYAWVSQIATPQYEAWSNDELLNHARNFL